MGVVVGQSTFSCRTHARVTTLASRFVMLAAEASNDISAPALVRHGPPDYRHN